MFINVLILTSYATIALPQVLILDFLEFGGTGLFFGLCVFSSECKSSEKGTNFDPKYGTKHQNVYFFLLHCN